MAEGSHTIQQGSRGGFLYWGEGMEKRKGREESGIGGEEERGGIERQRD